MRNVQKKFWHLFFGTFLTFYLVKWNPLGPTRRVQKLKTRHLKFQIQYQNLKQNFIVFLFIPFIDVLLTTKLFRAVSIFFHHDSIVFPSVSLKKASRAKSLHWKKIRLPYCPQGDLRDPPRDLRDPCGDLRDLCKVPLSLPETIGIAWKVTPEVPTDPISLDL